MKTLVYLSLTLAACRLFAQTPNPAWRHLPPDAAAIYHFNLAALTLDQPAVRQWTNRLHPSGCTLHDSLLWIGSQPMPPAPPSDSSSHLNTTPDALQAPGIDHTAPISGYLDCQTLSHYWKGLPFLSAMDKLTFTAGRLNATGQIENIFVITLADPRAYSLQTLWPLLGP